MKWSIAGLLLAFTLGSANGQVALRQELPLGPSAGAASGQSINNFFVVAANVTTLPKWCVNVHNVTGPTTAAQNLILMNQIGANCARDALNWDLIETVSNTYNWTVSRSFDLEWSTLCGGASPTGILPIMAPTYNNGLYAATIYTVIAPGANTTAYSNFAVAAANHFIGGTLCPGGFVIEHANEPNLTIGSLWWATAWLGSAYGTFAQTGAAAVKAAQPSLIDLTGGLSPGPGTAVTTFATSMVASSMTSINYYSSHPYSYNEGTPNSTPTPQQLIVDQGNVATAVLAQSKPLVITEYGFPLQALGSDCTSATSKNNQGIFTSWGMGSTLVLQTLYHAVYDLVDDGANCNATDQNTFGMFYHPGAFTPLGIKPAGTAFWNMGPWAFAQVLSYDILYYPSLSTYEINIRNMDGTRKKIIWQSAYGGTLGTPIVSAATWTENMGAFNAPSAINSLGASQALTCTGSSCSVMLPAEGQIIVTLPLAGSTFVLLAANGSNLLAGTGSNLDVQ